MAVVRVNVYENRVSALFTAGTDMDDFLETYQSMLMRLAFAAAPMGGSSNLKRSHRLGGRLMSGRYQRRAIVNNIASYAAAVHEGTSGPIMSSRPGGYMLVRAAPFSRYSTPTLRESVRGQRANPWMVRAGAQTTAAMQSYRKL